MSSSFDTPQGDSPKSLPDNRFLEGDPRRIDVNDTGELADWTKYLDISEGALRAALGAAGNIARDVKRYLAQLDGNSSQKLD